MNDEQRKLIDQATEMRKRALTAQQNERRELVERRSQAIQERGVRAVDGVTFGKATKDKR